MTDPESIIQMEFEVILGLFMLLCGMIGFVLMRVWRIPSMETKMDLQTIEVSRHRNSIHSLNNTLFSHETRITLLEKSKKEDS